MTTLIVGCGYLGQVVGLQLLSLGQKVIGTVRSPERAARLAELGIEPCLVNVLSPETLGLLPKADRTFYCVGFDRSAGVPMRSVYVDGLRNFLDHKADRLGKLVYASSTGVYGQADGSWVTEESPAEPTHESGKVCLEAETTARLYHKPESPIVVLRFAGLYGPGRIVRREALLRNEPVVGAPEKFLNLVHIHDAAQVVVAGIESETSSGCYLVCDDRPVTRREYYELAAKLLGAPSPRFENPAADSSEAKRDASNKRVSNQRLHVELGVRLKYPDITTGLAAALVG